MVCEYDRIAHFKDQIYVKWPWKGIYLMFTVYYVVNNTLNLLNNINSGLYLMMRI